jgi:hypothetical protein
VDWGKGSGDLTSKNWKGGRGNGVLFGKGGPLKLGFGIKKGLNVVAPVEGITKVITGGGTHMIGDPF